MNPVAHNGHVTGNHNHHNDNNNSVLWMGDVSTSVSQPQYSCTGGQQVDAAMDEQYLIRSFSHLNEPVEYVRVMRPKDGVSASGYAFIGFRDETTAQRVLTNWNGKPIPNSEVRTGSGLSQSDGRLFQGKRFKLNSSTRNQQSVHWNRHNGSQSLGKGGPVPGQRSSPSSTCSSWQRSGPRPRQPDNWTAFVGDVTVDMDDESFFQLFKNNYPSVFEARIMRLPSGESKQFAFVRFRDEAEYREALTHQTGISVQLGCQIRICKAHPRPSQPRRWSGSQSRPPVPNDLIDQSAKYHPNPALLSVNMDQQRMPLSSLSGHQPQPFPSDQVPSAVYYIPVPSYAPFPDAGFWSGQWQDLYPTVPLPEVPQQQQAFGPEAGDTGNMHAFPRPYAPWQVHLPPHHFVPDQRFLYNPAEGLNTDAPDSSAKADQFAD